MGRPKGGGGVKVVDPEEGSSKELSLLTMSPWEGGGGTFHLSCSCIYHCPTSVHPEKGGVKVGCRGGREVKEGLR